MSRGNFQGRGYTLGETPSTDLWMPTIQSYKKPISLARARVKAQPTVFNKTTHSIRRQLPPQKLASLSGTIRVKTPAIVKKPMLNEIKVLPKIPSSSDKTIASPGPKFRKPTIPVSPSHIHKNLRTIRAQKYTPPLVPVSDHAAPSAETISIVPDRGRTQKKNEETIKPVLVEEDFPQLSVTYELATCSITSTLDSSPPLPSFQSSPSQQQNEAASSSIRHPFYYTNEQGHDSTFTSTGEIDMTGVPHPAIEYSLFLPRQNGPSEPVIVTSESPLSIIWELKKRKENLVKLMDGCVECTEGGEESMDEFGPWDVRLVRDYWGRDLWISQDGDGKDIV